MKLPQTRLWIDARGEDIDLSQHAEVFYIINNLEEQEKKQLLVEAVYPLVKEIAILEKPQNAVRISFNPTLISPSFIDYLLQQKDLTFVREGG
ncbi:MAG: hypothetical protein JG781_2185 [Peptococcaceae bacterium]|jgi:hypothetical protein|nr:hypothetical protein [Peptococcaceae bacterium]